MSDQIQVYIFKSRFKNHLLGGLNVSGQLRNITFINGLFQTMEEKTAQAIRNSASFGSDIAEITQLLPTRNFQPPVAPVSTEDVPPANPTGDTESPKPAAKGPQIGIAIEELQGYSYSKMKEVWKHLFPGEGIPSRSAAGLLQEILDRTTAGQKQNNNLEQLMGNVKDVAQEGQPVVADLED